METQLAFVAYIIAVISLAISIYVAYLFTELKDRLTQSKKPQQRPRITTPTKREKGHWD
jgi:hypothetical protein